MSELLARLRARRLQIVAAMMAQCADPDAVGMPENGLVVMAAQTQAAIEAVESVEAEGR